MKCPTCSTDVPAESVYCPKCGERLDGAPVMPAAAVPSKADQVKTATTASRAAAANDTEVPLWKGAFSWKAMIGYWMLTLLVTIGAIVLAVVFAAVPMVGIAAGVIVLVLWVVMVGYLLYQRLSLEYELTNQRLITRKGILTRVTNRVEVIDIDDVQFKQNIIERMLNVGSIYILSSDVSDPKMTIAGIDDVKRVFGLVDDARRDERRKRGMYIETV